MCVHKGICQVQGRKFLGQPILTIFLTLGLLLNLALDLQGQHDATGMQRLEEDTFQNSILQTSNDVGNHQIREQKNSHSKLPIPLFTPHFGHGEFTWTLAKLNIFETPLNKVIDGQTVTHFKDRWNLAPPVPPPTA